MLYSTFFIFGVCYKNLACDLQILHITIKPSYTSSAQLLCVAMTTILESTSLFN